MAAFVLYVAVFLITIGVHVPLNDELEAAGEPDRIADLVAVRERFDEARWAGWNVARAVASSAAFACLTWALVLHGRTAGRRVAIDPTAPEEIAFADLDGTNTWSAYTYPRKSGRRSSIPVYSNDGLSRNYGTAAEPRYPEAAYGFQRFSADIGRTTLVGLNRLNPQLQERVIRTRIAPWRPWQRAERATPQTHAYGTLAHEGARNRSARPFEK